MAILEKTDRVFALILDDYKKQCAIDRAKYLYQAMTDYRWYSRKMLSWEQFQERKAIELDRFQATMYRIRFLGVF